MKVRGVGIPDVAIITLERHEDGRGSFMELWHRGRYGEHGIYAEMTQDNLSWSRQGVLRGMHYQFPDPQKKIVTVLAGAVLDVVLDIRRGSPTYGKRVVVELSAENRKQLYIGHGLAHGFLALTPDVLLNYKCDTRYLPDYARGVYWNDPSLKGAWNRPAGSPAPIMSERDYALPTLANLPREHQPEYYASESPLWPLGD